MEAGMHNRPGRESVEDRTLRLVQQHAAELLRFARRFSHGADDAHDAYQRSVEILVRRMRTDPPAQPLPWLRTVLRREALAVRREREQLLGRVELDLDRHEDLAAADPAEQAVGHERVRQTAEALQRLKPQEVTALVLRAEGLSYAEIGERMRWTYTRTNRCVTEGRRALMERLGAIESGAECARWLPQLSALADGEAPAEAIAELRPHLRSCSACRATLRELHAVPARVALLVPPAAIGIAAQAGGGSPGHVEAVVQAAIDRATLVVARIQGAFEALPGAKVAAVAASTVAIAGGGVALEQATHADPAQDVATRSSSRAVGLPADLRLSAIAFPSRAGATGARHGQRSGGDARREFARERSGPPEFASTPGAALRPEFAPQAGAASLAPAVAPPPQQATEFSSP
jgi:RNA polymerase sigma factor (sigma-70 family)